ncbi:hypothetical protein GQ600_21744 [Phytophthora cactorum]|nr:hypothetical protein GQ600_21744 [Phytophthora cactorum]
MAATGKGSAFSMLAETAVRSTSAPLTANGHRSSTFRLTSRASKRSSRKFDDTNFAAYDNKAALVEIIDHMRELGNDGEEAGDASKASQRNGPSPLERDRFRPGLRCRTTPI